MPSLAELRTGWFGLELERLADRPERVELPRGPLSVFVACDARKYEWAELVAFGRWLVSIGANYVCAWGDDCGRVEAAVDVAIVESGVEDATGECVVTTSHASESLAKALWFFDANAWPAAADSVAALVRLVIAVELPSVLEAARRGIAVPEGDA